MRAIFRRLIAQSVLPDGPIVGGSHQMMSNQLQEPFQLLICPINMPVDPDNDLHKYGTITNGVFHIYYRHRNMDDPAFTDDIWLNEAQTGYYAKLMPVFQALNGWWPVGDLADNKQGKKLTTLPLLCKTWNEPRRKYDDRSIGEGMFEIRGRFILDQLQNGPTA